MIREATQFVLFQTRNAQLDLAQYLHIPTEKNTQSHVKVNYGKETLQNKKGMWRIKSYVEHSLVAINYIFISYCNTKHSQLAGTGSDLFLNTRYTLVRYISVWMLLMFI